MKCPRCQTENPEGAKYRIECAYSCRTEPICPKCGDNFNTCDNEITSGTTTGGRSQPHHSDVGRWIANGQAFPVLVGVRPSR